MAEPQVPMVSYVFFTYVFVYYFCQIATDSSA